MTIEDAKTIQLDSKSIDELTEKSASLKNNLGNAILDSVTGKNIDDLNNSIKENLIELEDFGKKTSKIKGNSLMTKFSMFFGRYGDLEKILSDIEVNLISNRDAMTTGAMNMFNNVKAMQSQLEILEDCIECLDILDNRYQSEEYPKDNIDILMRAYQVHQTLSSAKQFKQILIQEIDKLMIVIKENQVISNSLTDAIENVVPIFKIQIATAINLKKQQDAMEIKKLVVEITNKLVVDNAQEIKKNTDKLLKYNDNTISQEALDKANSIIEDTLRTVKENQNNMKFLIEKSDD